MIVKSLDTINFETLMICFLKAFENYFVQMPTDHMYYKKRWEAAKVRLDLSYGMFDNAKLAGFIIHAIDHRDGAMIAFNTGTGVIPSYRGQQIIRSIYTEAIPLLKTQGINLSRLEVIKENLIAVKTYERIGFTITKNYKCYQGTLNFHNDVAPYELRKVSSSFFDWKKINQSYYSWDNHSNTILQDTYDYYVLFTKNTPSSYFIIKSDTGYITQFDVFINDKEHWEQLFAAIQTVSATIKINNVDERLTSKIDILDHIGITNTIDQYEMEFNI